MTTKKKKSAKQKRVLIVALIVAVAIVAGSTFAWFSSKDEVTNRLTASANYNVSIVEDFQPPADWLPGQTINKDVAAVNTGNVDAFVRMWLDGKLRLLKEDVTTAEPSAKDAIATVLPSASGTEFGKVTDPNRTKLGLNYYKKTGSAITYYKTLSTDKIENPNDINHTTNNGDEANNQPAAFSEVQSMQAAGVLAYAPADAKYTWTLEQSAELWVLNNGVRTLTTIAAGQTVGSVGSGATYEVVNGENGSGNYYGPIDASTFQPISSGLYLFRRNIEDTADGTANTYEYSGYYFVNKTENGAPTALAENTYFALHTADGDNHHSDYVVPADAVSETTSTNVPTADQELPAIVGDVRVFTATEVVLDESNNGLTWTYNDSIAGSEKFVVSTGTDPKDIVIDIALANIGTTDAEAWTAIKPASSPMDNRVTFYYNNDLEAGDTTVKLVDSVKLADDTQVGAYLAFDFDLNVYLDSVQVTLTEEGSESAVTVDSGWGTSSLTNDTTYDHANNVTPATGVKTLTNGEISKVTWTRFNG